MENNFHSTKELLIDRHSSYGSRIRVKKVKNALTKDGSFVTVVFPTIDVKDGDIYRKFFEMLDNGECKSKQGAVLKCDKKAGYYFDVSNAFPKGINFDSTLSTDSMIYFKLRTIEYENGTKEIGFKYRTVAFDVNVFPENTSNVQKAIYLKENLSTLKTKDNCKVFEYLTDRFDKVPDTKITIVKKFPKSINVTKVDSNSGNVTFKLCFDEIGEKTYTLNVADKVPMNLHKSLYNFYIAQMLENEGWIQSDQIKFNYATGNFKLLNKPVEVVKSKPVIAKVIKVISDPNSEEAKALIGKRVIGSQSYMMGKPIEGVLESIDLSMVSPFMVKFNDTSWAVSFIKEAPEPEYDCYNFDDPTVRSRLMLNRFKDECGTLEEVVTSFRNVDGRWLLNGRITSFKFLKEYTWIDGSKCGTIKEN